MATSRDVARRARELRELIEDHNYRYYVLDDPVVGDDESPSLEHAAATSDTTTPIATTADRPFIPLPLMMLPQLGDLAEGRPPAARRLQPTSGSAPDQPSACRVNTAV